MRKKKELFLFYVVNWLIVFNKYFSFRNLNDPNAPLELGMEVEYTLSTRNTGNGGSCASAENVKILPPGTINDNCELLQPNNILDGVVSRPLRSVNPEQIEYAGIIQEVPTSKPFFFLS